MTPSERAIQSRVKEAFALKVSPEIWNEIVSSIENETYQSPILKLSKDEKKVVSEQRQMYQFHSEDIYP